MSKALPSLVQNGASPAVRRRQSISAAMNKPRTPSVSAPGITGVLEGMSVNSKSPMTTDESSSRRKSSVKQRMKSVAEENPKPVMLPKLGAKVDRSNASVPDREDAKHQQGSEPKTEGQGSGASVAADATPPATRRKSSAKMKQQHKDPFDLPSIDKDKDAKVSKPSKASAAGSAATSTDLNETANNGHICPPFREKRQTSMSFSDLDALMASEHRIAALANSAQTHSSPLRKSKSPSRYKSQPLFPTTPKSPTSSPPRLRRRHSHFSQPDFVNFNDLNSLPQETVRSGPLLSQIKGSWKRLWDDQLRARGIVLETLMRFEMAKTEAEAGRQSRANTAGKRHKIMSAEFVTQIVAVDSTSDGATATQFLAADDTQTEGEYKAPPPTPSKKASSWHSKLQKAIKLAASNTDLKKSENNLIKSQISGPDSFSGDQNLTEGGAARDPDSLPPQSRYPGLAVPILAAGDEVGDVHVRFQSTADAHVNFPSTELHPNRPVMLSESRYDSQYENSSDKEDDDSDGENDAEFESGRTYDSQDDEEMERPKPKRFISQRPRNLLYAICANLPFPTEKECKERSALHQLHPDAVARYEDLRNVLNWAPLGSPSRMFIHGANPRSLFTATFACSNPYNDAKWGLQPPAPSSIAARIFKTGITKKCQHHTHPLHPSHPSPAPASKIDGIHIVPPMPIPSDWSSFLLKRRKLKPCLKPIGKKKSGEEGEGVTKDEALDAIVDENARMVKACKSAKERARLRILQELVLIDWMSESEPIRFPTKVMGFEILRAPTATGTRKQRNGIPHDLLEFQNSATLDRVTQLPDPTEMAHQEPPKKLLILSVKSSVEPKQENGIENSLLEQKLEQIAAADGDNKMADDHAEQTVGEMEDELEEPGISVILKESDILPPFAQSTSKKGKRVKIAEDLEDMDLNSWNGIGSRGSVKTPFVISTGPL
ncbi:hypothetical protein HDU97_002431 [Phlyctochytrium planicorne]|nr:hypothetical protein HDU97_002431 [Phlyctochytrium planicorne]